MYDLEDAWSPMILNPAPQRLTPYTVPIKGESPLHVVTLQYYLLLF